MSFVFQVEKDMGVNNMMDDGSTQQGYRILNLTAASSRLCQEDNAPKKYVPTI